eukprot:COSAG01_NODE_198_length_22280_cov_21.529775_15_plen_109_part_00
MQAERRSAFETGICEACADEQPSFDGTVAAALPRSAADRAPIVPVSERAARRVPWERAVFGYSRDIQHLRRQLVSRQWRTAERLELKSVINRLLRRFLEWLDRIYDTC